MTNQERENRRLRQALRLALKLITTVEKEQERVFHTTDCSVLRAASEYGVDIHQLACDCGHFSTMAKIYKLKKKRVNK
jgi:hypothetical protein